MVGSKHIAPERPVRNRILLTLTAAMLVVGLLATPALAAPANDNFVNAKLLRGTAGSVDGTSIGATQESDEVNSRVIDQSINNALGLETVWYRISVGAGETLVAHTCATDKSQAVSADGEADTALIAFWATNVANTSPTSISQLTPLQDNDDFFSDTQHNLPQQLSWNGVVSDLDCANADSTRYSWVGVTADVSRTLWLVVSPYGAGEDPDNFTLSWYKSAPSSATPQITSVKLTNSRADSFACVVTFKAKGLSSNFWVNMSLSNGPGGSLDSGFTNNRGVLSVTYTASRSALNNSFTLTAGLKTLSGTTIVSSDASYVTNNCSPAA